MKIGITIYFPFTRFLNQSANSLTNLFSISVAESLLDLELLFMNCLNSLQELYINKIM